MLGFGRDSDDPVRQYLATNEEFPGMPEDGMVACSM